MLKRMLVVCAAAIVMASTATVRAAETFNVDPVHSMVVFRIGHFGVSNIYGRFNEPTGKFVLDDASPENSTFEFQVEAAKIDTANSKRDDHLRSPDFFNVKQFPTINFKSTSVKKTGDNTFEVTGDLSLHGVTKSITVPVNRIGAGESPMGGYLTGIGAEFTIKRSDFGMIFMPDGIGDEVHLMVALEGKRE